MVGAQLKTGRWMRPKCPGFGWWATLGRSAGLLHRGAGSTGETVAGQRLGVTQVVGDHEGTFLDKIGEEIDLEVAAIEHQARHELQLGDRFRR